MVLYWVIRTIARWCFVVWFGVRPEGLENIPSSGAALLCANHRSWADPLLISAVIPRPLFYMAKEEMFSVPALAFILRMVGAFPVRRHSADRRALRKALALLTCGRVVALFPEGTRSRTGEIGKAEPGVALLAAWSACPVLPAAISGRYRRGQLVVRIGTPVHLTWGDRPRGPDLQVVADDQIMGAVRRLVDRQRRRPQGAVRAFQE